MTIIWLNFNMVEFQLVLETGVSDAVRPIYKYDFNRGDYNAIKRALAEMNWCEIFHAIGTLDCYKLFTEKLNELIACHVPVKKFKTKKKCLWFNRNVKKQFKEEIIKSGSCIVLRVRIAILRHIKNVATWLSRSCGKRERTSNIN